MSFSRTLLLLSLVCILHCMTAEQSEWEILVHLNETYRQAPQCNNTERGFMVTGLEIAWNHTLENAPEGFILNDNSNTPDCAVDTIDADGGDYDVTCPKNNTQNMKEVRGVGQGNGNGTGTGNANVIENGQNNRHLQTQECCICHAYQLPCADEDPCSSQGGNCRRRLMRTPVQPNLKAFGWIRNYVLESDLTDNIVYVYTEMGIECLLPVEDAIEIVIVARNVL